MSAVFRRKGDKRRYLFLDNTCLSATCWAPGLYQHRGATMSGSRSTGRETAECMNRAYHGCPMKPEHDEALARARKVEGWRLA